MSIEAINQSPSFWIAFNLGVIALLALDMGVFHRHAHTIKFKEALGWSVFWIVLALTFNAFIYALAGTKPAIDFLTGYVLEKSLSVDNIFVFAIIFKYFGVPSQYQYRVLFLGILGALIMRAIFIFAGIALLEKFSWMIFVFGALLIITGIKMVLRNEDEVVDLDTKWVVKLAKKIFRVTPTFEGNRFFVQKNNQLWATPLFIVLLVVEATDLVFAVDSIPAILAITQDPFIVYTSNVFAILGLRALYFALSGIMEIFHHMHYALAAVLTYIGVKMIISPWMHIPTGISLCIVLGTIGLSMVTSKLFPIKHQQDDPS